ncbi:hypothetical protein LTS18_013224 [Coniosporium uncinatum]|uniref:Uncharacterized protein n=1 Tax=Coniosporium uncinatum TaxID=93489 RepID=A0ACC3DIA8_9PEZI|nr:hypothetical protein LTS18_013224 [Coniosporium uncinatum]
MRSTLSTLALLVSAATVLSVPIEKRQQTAAACSQLADMMPSKLFLPDTWTYANESGRVWSETCLATPYCVFLPESAEDVSAGLGVMRNTNTQFAVRSAGHMPNPLSNNINDGVLFAMSRLDGKILSDDRRIVRVGPGQRWMDVYEYTSGFGLGVAGGRYSPVGVGGLLTGGGISYFGSKVGWSFNTIQNMEVVLGDGRIVNVNATSNPDLFWAMKGGSSNYGIVTRFDLSTFAAIDIWGGTQVYSPDQVEPFLEATSEFIQPGGGHEDPSAAIIPTLFLDPTSKEVTATGIFFHAGDDANPAAFANFTDDKASVSTLSMRNSFKNYTDETATFAYGARTSR